MTYNGFKSVGDTGARESKIMAYRGLKSNFVTNCNIWGVGVKIPAI